MILPKNKRLTVKKNPKRMLIFGLPKTGKTTILANLDDCLIVDMEEGSDYVEAMAVKVNSMKDFNDLMKALAEAKTDNGGKAPYKHIALDTLTALEELSLQLALKMYKESPIGINFDGKDVRVLANGAGYLWFRRAFLKMAKAFEPFCESLIMVGHVKEKDVSKNGDSFNEKSINLTGKTKDILCAWSDSIGLIYRDENKTIIDFAPSDNLVVGSRQKHLIGKKITIAESDEDNNLSIDWGKIYVDN